MRIILCFISLIFFIACGNNESVKTETKEATTQKATTHPSKAATAANNNNKIKTQKPPIQVNNKTRTQPDALSLKDYKAKNEGWMVNLEEAYAESKKTGKPIMANFTGSDWCGWCKRLDKSVFHTPEFAKWSKKSVVLLELDFPKRFRVPQEIATQNNSLKQAFGIRGYPTIWVFDAEKDADGKFNFKGIGKTGYTKTFDEFKNQIEGYIAAAKNG